MNNIQLVEELPSVDEYCAMRVAAGLSAKSAEAAVLGLPGSLFSVCLRQDGVLVGMGRIVGDGGLSYSVVDIAVHPDFQRQGLGSRIMEAISGWLHDNAPSSSYVSLLADPGAPALYKKFGFEYTVAVGMALRM